MGLLSAHGGVFRPPIRLHWEFSMAAAIRRLGSGIAGVGGRFGTIAKAAINDARVVALLLLVGAAALAFEMAASFR